MQGAAEKGHHNIVEELLIHGHGDTIEHDEDNYTPLHYASITDSPGAVSGLAKLLARGCNVNAISNENDTPLHLAIRDAWTYGAFYKVKELLNHGDDINIQNAQGDTALHKAPFYNHNFYLKDVDGKTVLDIAIETNNYKIARMIAKKMCPKPRITDSTYPLKHFI